MTDWELLQLYAAQRSEAAFAEIVRRHERRVYSVCLRFLHDRHLAEDAAQSVFSVLSAQASILAEGPLDGWFCQVARLVAGSMARSMRRRRRYEAEAGNVIVAQEGGTERLEVEEMVPVLLRRLGPKERAAVELRFMRGHTVGEVASALKISPEAAKKRIHRALDRLREISLFSCAQLNILSWVVWHWLTGRPGDQARRQAKRQLRSPTGVFAVKRRLAAGCSILATIGALILVGDHSRREPVPMSSPVTWIELRLRRRMAPLDISNIGLRDVIGLLSRRGGVTIEADWHAIELAGISRNTVFRAHLPEESLAQDLKDVLGKVSSGALTYAIHGDRIVVFPAVREASL